MLVHIADEVCHGEVIYRIDQNEEEQAWRV